MSFLISFYWFWIEIGPGHVLFWEIHPYPTLRWAWHKKQFPRSALLLKPEDVSESVFILLTIVLCTGIRKWTAGVERKENAPFGPGGEVEVKTCSWAFVLCTGRPKKKSREQKAVISYKYSAFRGSQFLWLPKRKRGGLCVGGGSAVRQMRDVSARVCVRVCISGCVYCPLEPCTFCTNVFVFPSYVLLTIWSRSPFLNDKSEAVLDS